MLKRVGIDQLRPGMFIHEICGSWMEHPFWRTSFRLDDLRDLQRLTQSGAREVIIDTARGVDVDVEPSGASTEAVAPAAELAGVDTAAAPPPSSAFEAELARAEAICARSKQSVVDLFSEIRMGRALDIGATRPVVEDIVASILRHPTALISLARMKEADDYTYMHSIAVCALMVALARLLGCGDDEVREIGLGGLLHDIGKMTIPERILVKPGPLSEDEMQLMRRHPAAGERILLDSKGIGDIPLDIALHHHEKIDGSGYPRRLLDGDIGTHARMAAICDVYDAMTADRRYKSAWNPAVAVRTMAVSCDGHFDPRLLRAFVKCIGIYPTGSLVRLQSGRLAVVIDQAGDSLLRPVVKVFYSIATSNRLQASVLDLGAADAGDAIDGIEDPRDWSLGDLNRLWQEGDGGR